MNQRNKMMTLVAGMAFSVCAGSAFAQEVVKGKCPVMTDEAVNFAVSTKTADGPVYFCCKGCIKKYKADPAKFAKGTDEQRKVLAKREKVQVDCPVSGEPVDTKISADHDGKKVYFCCNDCAAKFKKSPDKYKSALANSYTFQLTCPVMGGKVDPTAFTELASGLKVYYCCKGCEKGLFGEPGKYLPKLEKQGFVINKDSLVKAGEEKHDDHSGHDHSGHDHGGH